MGLDVVELVMEVEEAFDVQIPDSSAAGVTTLGQLHALVKELSVPRPSGACATHVAFNTLRRAISPKAGRAACEPDAPMSELMSPDEWRRYWRPLEIAARLRLPPLESPRWFANGSIAGTGVAAVGGFWAYGPVAGIALALGAGVVFSRIGQARLDKPAAPTFGEFCRSVAERNYGRLTRTRARWRDDEALEVLKGIMAFQFGVPREAMSPDLPLDPDAFPR